MDLIETLRCEGHHIVAENVTEVLRRHVRHIDGALEEAIVDAAVASVDKNIVVVAQGERAVQIEDYIAVSVFKEVSL